MYILCEKVYYLLSEKASCEKILRAYIDETVDEEIIEELIENNVSKKKLKK